MWKFPKFSNNAFILTMACWPFDDKKHKRCFVLCYEVPVQWKRQGRIGRKDKDKDKDKDRKKLGAKDRPEVKLRVRQVSWIIVSAFFLLAQIHKATLHQQYWITQWSLIKSSKLFSVLFSTLTLCLGQLHLFGNNVYVKKLNRFS